MNFSVRNPPLNLFSSCIDLSLSASIRVHPRLKSSFDLFDNRSIQPKARACN